MKYQKLKEKAKQEAIDWQLNFANNNYSYLELSQYQAYFTKQAKKYGLIKEFEENGII